jgi:dTDP-4-dehydrorhamnose reductase
MRVYVAGGGGMLGDAVYRTLSKDHDIAVSDIVVGEDWLHHCDVRDFSDYRRNVDQFAPDLLIHLAAHTDLEYCETSADDAYRTNTLGVEHAATIANARDIPLVYISTAGIFDGRKDSYDDWDEPNPLSVYGRSKYLGERHVQRCVPRHFIFRAGWMMGGGLSKDKKFVGKLVRQLLAGERRLHVVDDKLGTPTYTLDFARNIERMIGTRFYGLYNQVCGGETSRLEVAFELVRLLGLDDVVEVIPVSSDHYAREYHAPRPASERLVNYKLALRGMNHMRDWRICLAEYVREQFADAVVAHDVAACAHERVA